MLEKVENIYVHDAYNSLSIEGYAVTEELIQKLPMEVLTPKQMKMIKNKKRPWRPGGIFLAFQEVKEFIKENYGKKLSKLNLILRFKLVPPIIYSKVQSGLAKPSLLTGYRNKPVFIRGSRHTPVNYSFYW